MALPNSAYANLAAARPILKAAVARRAAALSEAQAEARLKNVVERTNSVLDRLDERQASLAAEIKRLTKLKSATGARIERIEDRCITAMQDAGLAQVAGIRCKFRIQTAAPALEVVDSTRIPAEFWRQPAPEVNKVLLKATLAANAECSPADFGCKLSSKVSLVRR